MSAVSGAERVVYVHVAEIREFAAKIFAVLLLARFEAGVFQKHALAVFKRGDFSVCVLADKVGCKRDFTVQKFVESVRDGAKRELFGILGFCLFDIFGFRCSLAFCGKSLDRFLLFFGKSETFGENVVRLAEVRTHNHFRAVLHKILDRGKRAHDSVLVGDTTVLVKRNVEITTNKYFLALNVYVSDSLLIHNELLWKFVPYIFYRLPRFKSRVLSGYRGNIPRITFPTRSVRRRRTAGSCRNP